jgi:hypothetical protein
MEKSRCLEVLTVDSCNTIQRSERAANTLPREIDAEEELMQALAALEEKNSRKTQMMVQ